MLKNESGGVGVGGGICHSINRYTKANNKYMKDYDQNKVRSSLKYWDINKLWIRNDTKVTSKRL